MDWDSMLNIDDSNIDDQWKLISDTLLEAKDKFIPHKLVKMGNSKKWTINRTDEMKILGNRRDRKWTRYMETGDFNHYKEFVKYRNKVKKLSRKNRRNFEHNLATNAKLNPKAIWKYINARLNINKEITDIYIDYNNTDSTLIEDQFKIVNIFADYFDSVFTIDENIINYPPLDKLPITEAMKCLLLAKKRYHNI